MRIVALVLLVANFLFFCFAHGWLDGMFGLSSIGDREPERVASQVRPGSIVLRPMAASSAGAAVLEGGCFEAGPIAAADADAAEAILRIVLGPGGWTDDRVENTSSGTPVVTHTYRVGNADAATATRLVALKLDASGRSFSACAKPPELTR